FALGAVIALSRDISEAPALLTAIAAGGLASVLALLALTVDESDEAFANVYSGAVSIQNLVPWAPQRVLVAGTAAIATLGAHWLLSGRHYEPADVFQSPAFRPGLIVAWLAGFCLYQWLYPNGPAWWT